MRSCTSKLNAIEKLLDEPHREHVVLDADTAREVVRLARQGLVAVGELGGTLDRLAALIDAGTKTLTTQGEYERLSTLRTNLLNGLVPPISGQVVILHRGGRR